MKKLIKKYLGGSSIERNIWTAQLQAIVNAMEQYYKDHPEELGKLRHGEFAFQPVRYTEGVEPYIDTSTGKPILNGQNILTRNGEVVTNKSQDWLDWLAETGQILPGRELPEILIEFNKDTGETRTREGSNWDNMSEEKDNVPIATPLQRELLFLENFNANDLIAQNLKKRQGDRQARAKTPGLGSLALLGAFGGLAAWDPLAFSGSILGAEIGGTTLDYPFLQQGYLSFGDWWLGPNASETAKEFSNLGTWLGGGFGWNAGKNITKQLGLNIKKPNVFFAKTGEANEGSIVGTNGNWQIKALMPGNALERKVAADGTVSWKDFEWYLKLRPVEPYDKIHLQKAAENFSKDKPIPYEELKKVSSDMIPKFSKTNSENLKGYGLDRLGYGHDSGAKEHYGMVAKIDPNEGVNAESIVFHNPIGVYDGRYTKGKVHFPNATLHMRGFTLDNEPGTYYYLEGLSDWTQHGLQHGDFAPGSIEEHMALTAQLRGIQEALLRAAETGNSVMRIPTPETVIKSLYWKTELTPKGRELIGENSKLTHLKFEEFVSENYPELNELRQVAIEAERKYNVASKAARAYIRNLRTKYILPEYVVNSSEFYHHPEQFLKFSEAKQIVEDIRILRLAEADALVEYLNAVENSNIVLRLARHDPRALLIEELGKKLEELLLSDPKYLKLENPAYNNIAIKYKAFPKHYRRLFGDKPEIRNVTDSKNNTWFEVDVPLDINTRSLIFNKIGDANNGSIAGGTTKEGLDNFIQNDIIPRLKNSGHINIPENFTYKVRQYDPEHDVFDALLEQRNLKGLAFNSLVTNDVTINGPFESQDFGLMAHEIGNHNLRYNLQPDYKPVPRYYLNKYLSHDIDEETLNILLNSHPGTAVILPLEKEILSDAYSFVETFAKIHPENRTKILEELSAINTLFRAQLSLNGKITGNELNTIIDNTTDGYILDDLKELMYTLAGIILKIEEITGIPENKIVFMSELELDSLAKQYPELQKICLKVREAMKKVGVFAPLLPFLNKKDQAK